MQNKVYIGLGTNLGDKVQNIECAYGLIEKNVGKILTKSSFYSSEPWGFQSEDEFINTVIIVAATLDPISILKELQNIEIDMGRVKNSNEVYESRIIDLDIIAFNDEIIHLNELKIPHGHINERMFVLVPLQEVDNQWVHPETSKLISDIIQELNGASNIQRLS